MADTAKGWRASEANELRELLGWKPELFARRLKVHKRTVIRWRDGQTDPTPQLWEDLDKLLAETARKLAPWLALDQLKKMQRRDILKLLAAGTTIPLGGVDLLWNGAFSQVSHASLSSLEDLTTLLAGKYNTDPAHMLLGPAMGHLEKVTALLSGSMFPSQRQRLQAIVADGAIFVGALSVHSGKLAQAQAHLRFAQDMAQQAGNMTLLAQAYAEQALLHYYSQSPSGEHDDPTVRVALLEQADQLARRHAPGIVQMAISAWLAEDKAAAQDTRGADEALDHSELALAQAQTEGPVGNGYCSTAGCYQGWGKDRLEGFRGAIELSLKRNSAIDTITTSLSLKKGARTRAMGLVDLAIALIAQDQPEQACACLTEAHTIGLSQASVTILHQILNARALMPPTWNPLPCLRQLDERLRML